VVAHFNHRLRGRESNRDEGFVARAARKLGLTFETEGANVRAHARQSGVSVEMAARELRHQFLARIARQHGCDQVALAHHADDQVETFFLRLLRGSGGEGLRAMRPASPSPADAGVQLIRPLLEVPRAALAQYAKAHGVRFRRDASNAATDVARNWIRHRLLPALERRLQPALRRTIQRFAETTGAEAEFVRSVAEEWLVRKGAPDFETLPPAVQRQAVHLQLRRLGVPASFELIEQLRRAPQQAVMTAPGRRMWRDAAGHLHGGRLVRCEFDSNQVGVELRGRAGELTFENLAVSWRVVRGPRRRGSRHAPVGREDFDADKVGVAIVLRHWQPGDRFQPSGIDRPVKLQDLFVNAKVPRGERHARIVALTPAGEVFWVEGLRISERFKCGPRTRRVLAWKWKRTRRNPAVRRI
jgi:tRNA(Ile)-lysidine synthase